MMEKNSETKATNVKEAGSGKSFAILLLLIVIGALVVVLKASGIL
jgi:hypothetical protein